MKDELSSNNRIITFFVRIGEAVICGVLFGIFVCLCGEDKWNEIQTGSTSEWQVVIVLTLCYFICALYGSVVLHKRNVSLFRILVCVLENMCLFIILGGVVLTVGGFLHIWSYVMLIYLFVLLICLIAWRFAIRFFIRRYRMNPAHVRFVVLVGGTDSNLELWHELSGTGDTGYSMMGYFDRKPNPSFTDKCLYLGQPTEVENYLKEHANVHYLFCHLPDSDSETIASLADYCDNHLVHFFSIVNIGYHLHSGTWFNKIGNVPYLTQRPSPLNLLECRLLKRAFDLIFSTLFLCTLFPIILVIVSLITWLTMPGRIFFRQKRNGLYGREFYMYKFRSMRENSQADEQSATENDPRKTKWGNIMRRLNIDELPQFINVFLGDMSIVGPRPHMLIQTNEYSKRVNHYMMRHFVKPGITGWSQVTGFRGEMKTLKDTNNRVKHDIWYITHWSFGLDLYIIIKTVVNMFKGDKKAY